MACSESVAHSPSLRFGLHGPVGEMPVSIECLKGSKAVTLCDTLVSGGGEDVPLPSFLRSPLKGIIVG